MNKINNLTQSTKFVQLPNDTHKINESQRQQIKDKYKARYEFYKKDSYIALGVGSTLAAVGALGTFVKDKNSASSKNPIAIGALIIGLASIISYPFYKPKKEKYDIAMQKELNEVV